MSETRHQDRRAQCEGKTAFQSAILAHKAASRRRPGKQPAVSYRCPHCGLWHLGTNFHMRRVK